jgi:hypothetical protein
MNVETVIRKIFPDGNYWMYWLYLPSVFVLMCTSLFTVVVIGWLDAGTTIQTTTFFAHMDFESSHRVPLWIMDLIGNALTVSGYIWIIFAIHTCASLVIDGTNVGGWWVFKIVNFILKRMDRDTL